MERKKFEVILDRLLEKSMGGSLRWKSTSDPESFLLVLKDSSISVSHELGFDGEVDREEEYVNFDFRNKDGEIVKLSRWLESVRKPIQCSKKRSGYTARHGTKP